jgi:hypothetical protein
MPSVADFLQVLGETLRDVLPLAAVLTAFQLFVLRRSLPNPRRLLLGVSYVLVGLVLFLMGLELAIFPVGKAMAAQLTASDFLSSVGEGRLAAGDPRAYVWVYAFAFAIGFSTTIAEPALIAVALKAEELSAGAIGAWGLRIGAPLHHFIIAGYIVVVIQTLFAPKLIVPLAYDSGGVTTSTVTVPLVAGLGLGLAESVPGRSPLIDGFGLIAFASLFPMITVMMYAQASEWRSARIRSRDTRATTNPVTSEEDPR